MQQTQQVEQDEVRNDPAFEVTEVNVVTGETTVIIQRGIIGALANQLKTTTTRRKGSSILRKLGYVLADCGNVQYGGNVDETDLDPNLVVNNEDTESQDVASNDPQ